jgi:hypothetical protein
MGGFSATDEAQRVNPLPGEIEEALHHPNGWVYRIAGRFSVEERVPPEAIIGAWKVDENGKIVGDFVANPKFNPSTR